MSGSLEEDLLVAGVGDWVHFGEVAWLAAQRGAQPGREDQIAATLAALRNLQERGLMEIGDVGPDGFTAWHVPIDEVEERVREIQCQVTSDGSRIRRSATRPPANDGIETHERMGTQLELQKHARSAGPRGACRLRSGGRASGGCKRDGLYVRPDIYIYDVPRGPCFHDSWHRSDASRLRRGG
jgi:hypothetical protein